MKIAVVDLDHVLTEWSEPFWLIAADVAGIDRKEVKPPTEYGLSEYKFELRRVMTNLFNSRWFMCDAVREVDGAGMFMRWCSDNYDKVLVVTSRPKNIEQETIALCKRFWERMCRNMEIHVIHSTITFSACKAQYVLNLGYDLSDIALFVDDSEKECANAAETGISVLGRVYMPNRPWNEASWNLPGVITVQTLELVMMHEYALTVLKKGR